MIRNFRADLRHELAFTTDIAEFFLHDTPSVPFDTVVNSPVDGRCFGIGRVIGALEGLAVVEVTDDETGDKVQLLGGEECNLRFPVTPSLEERIQSGQIETWPIDQLLTTLVKTEPVPA